MDCVAFWAFHDASHNYHFTKGLIGPTAEGAHWVQGASIMTYNLRKWVVHHGLCNNIPHDCEQDFFQKLLISLLKEKPFAFEGIHKICHPKKWVLQPLVFPMIPHTTVSRPFYKRLIGAPAGDAL